MLPTSIPDLELRPLDPSEAGALHALIEANREHLTAHGDYTELVATGLAQLTLELGVESELRLGVYLKGHLIGQVDLVAVDPPRYGLGYWLAANATGRGFATAAVTATVGYAHERLDASDIFAGVSHGNRRSVAVLERVGFRPVQDFARYTRFHLSLLR